MRSFLWRKYANRHAILLHSNPHFGEHRLALKTNQFRSLQLLLPRFIQFWRRIRNALLLRVSTISHRDCSYIYRQSIFQKLAADPPLPPRSSMLCAMGFLTDFPSHRPRVYSLGWSRLLRSKGTAWRNENLKISNLKWRVSQGCNARLGNIESHN